MNGDLVMDEQKKAPGTGKGTGRRLGSKNLVKAEVKRDIAEFFKGLTIESMRWRTNVRRHPEQAHDAVEFRYWTRIALEYSHGLPIKAQPPVSQRQSLNFITSRGLPWQNDPLAEQERQMIAASEAEEARLLEQKALEAARPPAAEGDAGDEALELVRNLGDR